MNLEHFISHLRLGGAGSPTGVQNSAVITNCFSRPTKVVRSEDNGEDAVQGWKVHLARGQGPATDPRSITVDGDTDGDAVPRFDFKNPPSNALDYYSFDSYRSWGMYPKDSVSRYL